MITLIIGKAFLNKKLPVVYCFNSFNPGTDFDELWIVDRLFNDFETVIFVVNNDTVRYCIQ